MADITEKGVTFQVLFLEVTVIWPSKLVDYFLIRDISLFEYTHTHIRTLYDFVLLTNELSKFSNTKASQPFISYLQILGRLDLFDIFVR